jgi:hypothetical protein
LSHRLVTYALLGDEEELPITAASDTDSDIEFLYCRGKCLTQTSTVSPVLTSFSIGFTPISVDDSDSDDPGRATVPVPGTDILIRKRLAHVCTGSPIVISSDDEEEPTIVINSNQDRGSVIMISSDDEGPLDSTAVNGGLVINSNTGAPVVMISSDDDDTAPSTAMSGEARQNAQS